MRSAIQTATMQKLAPIPDLFILVLTFLCLDINKKIVSGNNSTDCQPAEEGQPYNLTFTWTFPRTTSYTNIIVENIHSLVSTCMVDTNLCVDVYSGGLAGSSLFINQVSGAASLTVALRNVSEKKNFNAEGKWTLKYGPFETPFIGCVLRVVSKEDISNCTTEVNAHAICVTCLIQKSFPNFTCLFFSKSKELDLKTTGSTVSHHRETRVESEHPSIISKCTLKIPVNQLRSGNYHLVAKIYQITGNDGDLELWTETSVFMDFDRTSLADCQPVLDVATDGMCSCERSAKTMLQTTSSWSDNNNNSLLVESFKFNNVLAITTIYSEIVTPTIATNVPLTILLVVGGGILIILTLVSILLCVTKAPSRPLEHCLPCHDKKTKPQNDYDAINGGYLMVDHSWIGDDHHYGTTRDLPTNIKRFGEGGRALDENHYETIDDVRSNEDRKCDTCTVETCIEKITDDTVDIDVNGKGQTYSTIAE